MNQVLYDKYKVVLGEQLKKDILEAALAVYGEKRREQFEQNMAKIEVHTKITWYAFKEIVHRQLIEKLEQLVKRYQEAYGIEKNQIGFDFDTRILSDIDYRLQTKSELSMSARKIDEMFSELFGEEIFTLLVRKGDRLAFNSEFAQTEEQRKTLQRSTSRI